MRKILFIGGMCFLIFSCSNPNEEPTASQKIDNYVQESKMMLGDKAKKIPAKREFYFVYLVIKSSDLSMIKANIISFFSASEVKDNTKLLYTSVDGSILMKIPDSYTFGKIASLITWLEKPAYAVIINKTNTERIYFYTVEELSSKDCVLGQFRSGEAFKIYIPDASYSDIYENSYNYNYTMDEILYNKLDYIVEEGSKSKFKFLIEAN